MGSYFCILWRLFIATIVKWKYHSCWERPDPETPVLISSSSMSWAPVEPQPPVEPHTNFETKFETICLDQWHSTHVNGIWSTSVNWPQLSIRVSWWHWKVWDTVVSVDQIQRQVAISIMVTVTGVLGCDYTSLKSKSLLRKGSSKWTGVSWWCTWHCADQRYEETAKADNRHPSPRESFERTRLTDKNVWSRTRRSRPRRHSIQGTPTYHSRDIRIRASWKDQHTKNCKKWYA